MKEFYTIWPGNLPSAFIDAVVNVGEKQLVAPTGMGFDGKSQNNDQRRSEIRWINTYNQEHKFIIDTIWNFVADANKSHYGFDVNYLRDIQYTKYFGTDNGKYDWHIDTFWVNPSMYHRKLSMTIQLSDPSEYEGGEFEFESEIVPLKQEDAKKKGTVLVFPSFLKHRVTPVTRGTRKSLVAWFEGPKFR